MKKEKCCIVIAGGGTAGWMTAAALSNALPKETHDIYLVESELIGTVGVGEATIPHIRQFNHMLGIDENEFISATNATYKLAIQFENWGQLGDKYMHPFGEFGASLNGIGFQHFWLASEKDRDSFHDYSVAIRAAKLNKFEYPNPSNPTIASSYSYAFHLDATLYAKYLRSYAEGKGVKRIEGIINDVVLNVDDGSISGLLLNSGEIVAGDFFVDCTGFKSFLLGEALGVGFESWKRWLPCDRAVAVPSESTETPKLYTRAIADQAGWRWRIPLQNRTGNGYVYSSNYTDDCTAESLLEQSIEGTLLAQPKIIKFEAGRRFKSWEKNCVAIGLSGGFLEPLESTSIYLIQIAIQQLINFLSVDASNMGIASVEYNRLLSNEYERIKDFLILHYKCNRRSDTQFWIDCQNMEVPDSLKDKMDLFYKTARVQTYRYGLFMEPSWLAVMLGQGQIPTNFDNRLKNTDKATLREILRSLDQEIESGLVSMVDNSADITKLLALKHGCKVPGAKRSLYGVR